MATVEGGGAVPQAQVTQAASSQPASSGSVDSLLFNKYRLVRKIGSGCFGELYLGENVQTGDHVAIKLEARNARHPQLYHESRVMKLLYSTATVGFTRMRQFGVCGHYNVMVVDLLGPSLEDYFNYCNRQFSLKTVLMLGMQMLSRIKHVHANGIIHRDIKPDNFLVGTKKKSHHVYVIDFGLSKKFDETKKPSKHCSLTGTPRYASVNAHLGVEQCYRDDLESLGYVLLYFLRGSLPWQGLQAKNKKERLEKISQKKMETAIEALCENHPAEFVEYLRYCRGLKYAERPDYQYLKDLLKSVFVRESYQMDYLFDWVVKQRQEEKERIKARLFVEGGGAASSSGGVPSSVPTTAAMPVAPAMQAATAPQMQVNATMASAGAQAQAAAQMQMKPRQPF